MGAELSGVTDQSVDEILFAREGAAGVVTLNRPKALNAVTHRMVGALAAQLAAWRDDPAVACVVLRASGEKAFSAGGDIRALYDLGKAGHYDAALSFWRDEYLLNAAIRDYPKPYISLIDGIVMGGGVGISVNGAYRVAGDKFQFAMPEVSIGFFPDVGATFILPRLPGMLGTWAALTGDRIRAHDAVASGVATHRVASARFDELMALLRAGVPAVAALARCATPPASLSLPVGLIDRCFSGDRVEDILAALDAVAVTSDVEGDVARATAATIRTKSPTSLRLALAQMRRGREWTFVEAMRMEFRIVSRVVHDHDFYEGVRALIVDKDNTPRWRPATLPEVRDAEIERHFAPLPQELPL